MSGLSRHISDFCRSQSGAVLVEFGMVLPVLFVFMATIIEGGRMTWAYQSVAGGVRDAARMIARVAPPDMCPGGSVAGYTTLAETIVTENTGGGSAIPAMVTVVDVTPSLRCVSGTYRVSPAAVVEVRARVRIDFIFGNVFGLFGTALGPLETEIADQSRVFGT